MRQLRGAGQCLPAPLCGDCVAFPAVPAAGTSPEHATARAMCARAGPCSGCSLHIRIFKQIYYSTLLKKKQNMPVLIYFKA